MNSVVPDMVAAYWLSLSCPCAHRVPGASDLHLHHYAQSLNSWNFAAGKIEGDIRINGHPKEQATFARVSGYVEQFDTHTAASTVYEALLFSGTLRNGTEVDAATTKKFVDQVS